MSISASKVTDNTNELSFHELFSQTTQVQIPLFQREYVWTEKQFKRMTEEVEIILEGRDSNRFLGAVIAVKRDSNPATPQTYEIVDGQQRLSTLYLFVLAAAFVAAKHGEDDYARGIINTNLIIDWWQSGINTKLVPSYADRAQFKACFQQLIRSGNMSDWLGVKAKLPESTGSESGKYLSQFNRIKSYLTKKYKDHGVEHLKQIITTAQTKLTFVFILLKDPANATTVFEGLNDPGIPIGIGDLVRNEVFSKVNADPDRAFSIHRDLWLPFRKNLGEYFDNFFFPYAIIREPSIKNADLFRGLRSIWGETQDPQKIIEQLDEYSQPYLAIAAGKIPLPYERPVKNALTCLKQSGSPTSIYPFVMKLLKEYELGNVPVSDTTDCLTVLESFLIRRAICGIEPTGLLVFFRTAWNVMDGKPSKSSLIEALKRRSTIEWPDDDRLTTAIKNRNIYSSNVCKYIMLEYEKSLGADFPENVPWIEHILPQSLNEEWKKVVSVDDHQNVVHTWGNLVPLTKEMNRELSQSEFLKKRDEIRKSSIFASARKLVDEYERWDKATILARSESIAEWARHRWTR